MQAVTNLQSDEPQSYFSKPTLTLSWFDPMLQWLKKKKMLSPPQLMTTSIVAEEMEAIERNGEC